VSQLARAFVSKVKAENFSMLNEARLWLKNTTGALNIEVGCGVGLHPIQYALQHPHERIIAIERTSHKFSKFNRRLANHNVKNLFAAHTEATIFLPHLIEKTSVHRYFFLYPNPYPKSKHKNLRWGNSLFMQFVKETLLPQGELHFATNIKSYADELVTNLEAIGFKVNAYSEVPTSSRRTHFEIKYLKMGETCYSLVFKKA
jgi:tRNA (guanine-N(7)-)-methyltransferase